MSDAGKGDDYRPVDKKRFDENYTKAFGKRDELEFHKDKNSTDRGTSDDSDSNR